MARRWLAVARLTAIALSFLLAGFWVGTLLLEPERPPAAQAGELVRTLPAVSLPDLQGRTRSLREWSGQTLLINFWATWCAPCREEMPLLQTLHEDKQGEDFAVIGIAVDRLPAVQGFVNEWGISYPQLIGQEAAMQAAEAFGPEFLGLPFSVFAGPDGEILGMRRGAVHAEELQAIVAIMDAYASGDAGLEETRRQLEAD